MSYQASPVTQKLINLSKKKGKNSALILPNYIPFPQRIGDVLLLLNILAIGPLFYFFHFIWGCVAILTFLVLFAIRDLFLQDDHAIVRIYGPFGRLRFIFENLFRDKYLQYFNESNVNGRPMPRIVRDYVYTKAHALKPLSSFGTELDLYDPNISSGCRVLHRNFPGTSADVSYGFVIGEHRSVKPFHVKNVVNISGMSYGSINHKAAEAISFGAKDVAYVNTGEGGFGPHGIAGNDIVFQIGTGKFGVGDEATLPNGKTTRVLNDQALRELVTNNPHIGLIQIKISQGAKPGIGGHLPGDKVTPEIAAVRRITPFKTIVSPSHHAELMAGSPKESINKLMEFCDRIRKVTERPVGIKMCVGRLDEIDLLVQAMQSTGSGPDAIQIDGADGGTGAGPNLFVNYVGYGGAIETVRYLDKKLKEAKIRPQVKISASGRIFTPAHAALAFACGADTIDSARAAMLSLGCIQSLKCHTNHCPTGIATNSPWRMHGLNIPEKSTRIHNFLKGFHTDMMEVTHVMGRSDPRDIELGDLHLIRGTILGDHLLDDPQGIQIPSPHVYA